MCLHKSVFMSPFKMILLGLLVALAGLSTGLGGLRDMIGGPSFISKEHGWNDGLFLMLLAILVALVLK